MLPDVCQFARYSGVLPDVSSLPDEMVLPDVLSLCQMRWCVVSCCRMRWRIARYVTVPLREAQPSRPLAVRPSRSILNSCSCCSGFRAYTWRRSGEALVQSITYRRCHRCSKNIEHYLNESPESCSELSRGIYVTPRAFNPIANLLLARKRLRTTTN